LQVFVVFVCQTSQGNSRPNWFSAINRRHS